MNWRASYRTEEKFASLSKEADAGSRGLGLELFLAEMFGQEHFWVEKNFVADGRQIDLFVVRGDLRLLVEAKWAKKRSQHDVIDEMRARLESAPPGVIGLVVSMSGYTPKVIERVERFADRPILLMDGDEVKQVVSQGGGLYSLVRSKMDVLARERRVVVGLASRAAAPPWLRELPEAGLMIVDPEGRQHPWWESRGDFSQQVTSLVSADPSWARAGGVRLDLAMGVRDANEVVSLLKRLTQLGFVSAEGTWRIEQQGAVWSGLGPAELARQLTDWDARYRGRVFHHHESVMYADESDDGMVCLAVDVSATSERLVRWCEVSFMLPGIPLDPTPYEALTADLPIMNTPSFQVLQEDPVRRRRLVARGKPRAKPSAYLVRDTSANSADGQSVSWVEGIVATSPTLRAAPESRLEAGLRWLTHEETFVRLRQHHHFGDLVTHDLLWATLVQASCASVFHVMGDWEYAGDRD